jgi:hypothetical protein
MLSKTKHNAGRQSKAVLQRGKPRLKGVSLHPPRYPGNNGNIDSAAEHVGK